jgi:hypothetical protein
LFVILIAEKVGGFGVARGNVHLGLTADQPETTVEIRGLCFGGICIMNQFSGDEEPSPDNPCFHLFRERRAPIVRSIFPDLMFCIE